MINAYAHVRTQRAFGALRHLPAGMQACSALNRAVGAKCSPFSRVILECPKRLLHLKSYKRKLYRAAGRESKAHRENTTKDDDGAIQKDCASQRREDCA